MNLEKINNIEIEYLLNSNIRFVCLTETWAKQDTINHLNFDKFYLGSHFCRENAKGGGVAIWVNQEIESSVLDVSRFCIEKSIELCAVCVSLGKISVIIVNCYRSPCGDINVFLNNIDNMLNYLYKPNVSFILCGDMNLDSYMSNGSINKGFSALCNIVSCFNLLPIVKWPTRVTDATATTIDHIFTNIDGAGDCFVLDNTISDHRVIFFQSNLFLNKGSQSFFYERRIFSDVSISSFYGDLCGQDWSMLYALENINEAFNLFFSVFFGHFDRHFPVTKCYKRGTDVNKKWITPEVKNSSSALKDLYKLSRDYPFLKESYNVAKRKHNSLVKHAKRAYYQSKIFSSANPGKMAWKVISDISGKSKTVSNSNLNINHNDNTLHDPQDIANLFNTFFVDAPKVILNKINKSANGYHSNVADNHLSFFLRPLCGEEVLSILNCKLKNKWSAGNDEIPVYLLKKAGSAIIEPLTFLINLSFSSGEFPNNLKTGKVVPIFKKGDPQLVDNYRPVCVSSSFSKIFEYAFLDRLLCFLDKYNIITEKQHGFISGKSTNSAIHNFYERVLEKVDMGECPVGIFFDLSRAFDCVSHTILCDKLFNYGIRGNPLRWAKSFLENRNQYVSIEHHSECGRQRYESDRSKVNVGIPQGSILGPLFFILYINDIVNVGSNIHFTIYADDTSIVMSNNSPESLRVECASALKRLHEWFSENDLLLNANKTQALLFQTRQRSLQTPPDITVNGEPILFSDSVKFLGVGIDRFLSWKPHCQAVCARLNSIAYQFRVLSPVLTARQLLALYHAQVGSKISYGICFWGGSSMAPDILLCQKKVLRIIKNVPSTYSCRNLFKDYNILTVTSLFIFELCVYVFLNKAKFRQNFMIHHFNTRQRSDFHIPTYNLSITKNAPNILGIKLFNSLPADLKNINNLLRFKKELKKFLVNKSIYSLNEFFVT